MRILITNDDGLHNDGLEMLHTIASGFGDTTVVAPDRDKSGVGQAITLTRPLRVKHYSRHRHAILDGTPTDCVYLALNHLMRDARPDLVLSGINPGPNLGWDILYSGTVAGAREAVLQGIPAVALSLVSGGKGYPFGEVAGVVKRVIQLAIAQPPPRLTLYNVNIPNPRVGPLRGIRPTRLGERYYSKEVVVRTDPRGHEYLWIGGDNVAMPDMPGSDCNAIKAGYVSITPLKCDVTNYEHEAQMTRFDEEFS